MTRHLSDWVGRSPWLYKFLVKVISISLTFDLQCPLVLQHDYSLTRPEGIQSTFSRESGQRNKRLVFFVCFFKGVEKSYSHGASLCYVFMLYMCTCLWKSSWQREWERAKCQCFSLSIYSTACLFFISVIRPALILRCLCCHCCKLCDFWPLVQSYCLLLTNYDCLLINKLKKKGGKSVQQTTFGDKTKVSSITGYYSSVLKRFLKQIPKW